ncbi:MAG: sigma-70 family RNA polymerase sigma factor [Bacteroidales bacterium]|nr:sigma-70 family RNA polymerase sigma factor [Bacteroidales bacterium]
MKRMIKDRDIVAGCKADKPKSQRLLYDKYCRMVMGVALRYCPNREEAEDLAQEIFIKIFTKIHQLHDEITLTSWIHRISTHTCIDMLRAKKRPLTIPYEEMPNDIGDMNCNYYEDIPTEKLLAFIQDLPEGCRTVFNLCVIDGLSYEEAAAMLSCSETTLRAQCCKARKILIKKIENYEKTY